MTLPDKQTLLNEVDGMERLPPSDLESILTGALYDFLIGQPWSSTSDVQTYITQANQMQCLTRADVQGLLVRKFIALLQVIEAGVAGPQLHFGNGDPEGIVQATGYALYRDVAGNGLWAHDVDENGNTGWVRIV